MDKLISDLNLLTIYLNSWEEESRQEFGAKIRRCWKEYPMDALNELEKNGLICQSAKSMILTKEGTKKAKAYVDIFDKFLEILKS